MTVSDDVVIVAGKDRVVGACAVLSLGKAEGEDGEA